MTDSKGTVFLLDDEPDLVKALARLLRAEGFAVRGFASVAELLAADPATCANCLVLDVSMPDLSGLELQQQLAEAGIQVPIVFLTGRGDIPMSVQAMKAGAVDFLTKPVDDADLIRAVQSGIARSLTQRESLAELSAIRQRYATLTPRESEVMLAVVAGKPNKQIAVELGTGEQTVKVHRSRVMAKMAVESLADLVRAAARLAEDA